jgi:hypothetical protein
MPAVSSAALCEGISITFVRDRDGWQFNRWEINAWAGDPKCNPPPAPTPEHQAMRFGTVEEALAFFRGEYAASRSD